MSQLLISVIMPCHNQAQFLPEAVASLQAQTYPYWECIIVNDGSSDNTAKVGATLVAGDPRVRLVNQQNRGLPGARNRGLDDARGELIHFLDADDYILPQMYKEMTRVFQTRSDVSVVYSGYQFVKANREPLRSISALAEPADVFHNLLERNLWPCHAVMVRKAAIDSVGVFDESLRSCEDWDLWLRVASTGTKFAPVRGEFACYRRHSDCMSNNGRRMLETGFAVIEKNLQWHRSCRACKAAAVQGRKRWCLHCWTVLRSGVTGGLFAYVPLFLRVARTDLRLTGWVLSSVFRKVIGQPAVNSLNTESCK
jgi:glycosyltransferase involved in cell wall biosynthesis